MIVAVIVRTLMVVTARICTALRVERSLDSKHVCLQSVQELQRRLGEHDLPFHASFWLYVCRVEVGVQALACPTSTMKREFQRAESVFGAPTRTVYGFAF